MSALKQLNSYLKNYKTSTIFGALFLTGANFFLVWIPIIIRRTIDQVEALSKLSIDVESGLFNILFTSEAGKILAYNAFILTGSVVLYGLLLFATRQTLIVSSRRVEYDMRNEMMAKLMALPQKFFAIFSTGEVYVRATEDQSKVRDYYGPVIMYSINTVTRAGFVIAMMFIVNKQLMFWALLPIPFISFFAYRITKYIHKHSIIIQEQYSELAGKANETFSNIRLIKAYNRTDNEQSIFDGMSEDYRRKKLRLDLIESLFHPTLYFLIGISVVIVIWKGGNMVIENTLSIGNIAEFLIYVIYLTWPVAALGYTTNRFQRSLASWQRIKEVLDYPEEARNSLMTEQREINGKIEFKNVSFAYPESKSDALTGLNFVINAGETVAFVGRTGAGKTSLVQLIPKLYDAGEGNIYIDDIDINNYNLEQLRDAIGYVPQETFLFSDTIEENIAFGAENAETTAIERAAEQARVRDNILEFENKFKTVLGERGITLSGGQKQRTAIARALIKQPKVLILDDSLSAVDTKTEDEILKHLKNDFKETTKIIISHRISTIKDVDRIYYLKEGKIMEAGSHNELLKLKGHYSSMYNKQKLEQELAEI